MCERNRSLRRSDFLELAKALRDLKGTLAPDLVSANSAFDSVLTTVATTCGHSNTKFNHVEFCERVMGTYKGRKQP